MNQVKITSKETIIFFFTFETRVLYDEVGS